MIDSPGPIAERRGGRWPATMRVYFGQVAVLLFGNIAAQLVNLASYPFLTRLYTPAQFGGFAIFLTVVGILGPVACARFDVIVQSSRDWQLSSVVGQALRLNGAVALAATLGAAVYALATGKIGAPLVLAVGIGVALTGYTLTATALLIRREQFVSYSRSMLVRSLATAAGQIGLWFLLPQARGLILGFCLGFAVQAVLLRSAIRGEKPRRRSPLRRRAIVARYRRQVLTDVPSTLIAATVLNVMSLLLLDLYSHEEVGFYSLAFRVAVLPVSIVTTSLAEVFFQKASAGYRRSGAFWGETRLNILATSVLSLLVFLPMALFARPAFAVAFGPRWLPAADLLILLTPMLAVRFVSLSIQSAPLVVGKAKWVLAQNIGLIAAIAASYAMARAFDLPIAAFVLATSLAMASVYAAFLVLVARAIRRDYAAST
jgi:O-antigen/teichoic acid export membrane protein